MTNNTYPASLKIEVTDSSGKPIGRTYEKRAKGLVKKGRARFTDENRITLLPSEDAHDYIYTEGNKMDEKFAPDAVNEQNSLYTIENVMMCMKKILCDSDYIKETLEAVENIPSGDAGDCGSPGDIAGKAKAETIREIISEREATNRMLIDFYNKVYDDIKNKDNIEIENKLKLLNSMTHLPIISENDELMLELNEVAADVIGSMRIEE